MRPDDLQTDPLHCLQSFPPGDEGREDEVAERAVVEQELAQDIALDGDIAERLRHDRGQEDGLAGEEVQFAEEARRAVPDDLVPGGIDDCHLAFADRDERIGRVTDPVERITNVGCALLSQPGQSLELRGGERRHWRE